MSNKMGTSSGQPASRGDYEALMRISEQLDEAIEREPGDDMEAWLGHVQAAVRSLSETLEEHECASEEEGGMLPEATAEKPSLMAASKRLEREHADMRLRASEIQEEVERELAFQEFKVELVRLEVAVLRDILRLHLLRANWLAYDAYFRVEGGEGG